MKAPLLIIGLFVIAALIYSALRLSTEKTPWRLIQLAGAICLFVVVLAHIAEAFNILPGMGWGLPDSAGHYLDLSAAILGIVLFPAGLFASGLQH